MRRHFKIWTTIMTAIFVMMLSSMQVFADESPADETTAAAEEIETLQETEYVVETITLDDTLIWNSKIPADLSWKTAQDKGKWIEELGIAKDAKSLILVLNNLDKEDKEALPLAAKSSEKERLKLLVEYYKIKGKSRLMYFSKNPDGEWTEVFATDCYISGGETLDQEAIYGAYTPVSSFGNYENPGSLLPYKELTSEDCWTLDMEHESYGTIFSEDRTPIKEKGTINLEGLKSYTNYGMILKPEEDFFACPHLIIHCQQSESRMDLFSGIQMPQEKLRMMIQSIDAETRFVIAESVEELKNL